MNPSEGRPVSAGLPDLVYIVGPHAEACEELRYSLRSVAANLPHRRLWLVGTVPSWASERVARLPLEPVDGKYQNMRQSLTAAANHPEVSDSLVWMNDDMFVVRQVPLPAPVRHLGPIREYLDWLVSIGKRENEWMTSMRDTLAWTGGSPDCYETHTPLLFDKAELRQILNDFPEDKLFAPPGVYHLAGVGGPGVRGRDAKVTSGELDPESPFLSTEDWSFRDRPVGDLIRRLFPEKCEYES